MAVGEELYGAGLERAAIVLAMARVKVKPDGPQLGQRRFSRSIPIRSCAGDTKLKLARDYWWTPDAPVSL